MRNKGHIKVGADADIAGIENVMGAGAFVL
jgi:hypothetical protein